ncbi:hypothetical protein FNU76_17455 [Chitinimonas arctica]|uniref:Uncharacterized protein n=1 Tax=Chitinimonas arctica TaxID=2594795 RepID=A0A516SIW8_9NEIS|nr:hypothetical protein [Chitinimonas arctica]QDQ27988.1 hypothetical protein FNU76_17455 [Chitinimonas arctica]
MFKAVSNANAVQQSAPAKPDDKKSIPPSNQGASFTEAGIIGGEHDDRLGVALKSLFCLNRELAAVKELIACSSQGNIWQKSEQLDTERHVAVLERMGKELRSKCDLWLAMKNSPNQDLSDALERLKRNDANLRELEFNRPIGDDGVILLAEALKGNTWLSWLQLPPQQTGVAAIHALANMLKQNASLNCLILNGMPIDDEAAQSLADGLRKNRGLSLLELRHAELTSEGVQVLAEGLADNRTLRQLDLRDNGFGAEGAMNFLQCPTDLCNLFLDDVGIDKQTKTMVNEKLFRNRRRESRFALVLYQQARQKLRNGDAAEANFFCDLSLCLNADQSLGPAILDMKIRANEIMASRSRADLNVLA